MSDLRQLQANLERMRPLRERDVETYLKVLVEVADLGSPGAARTLLLELDDRCDLGGVMQSVAGLAAELPSAILVPVLLDALPVVAARAETAVLDVMRPLLLSKEDRAALKTLANLAPEEVRVVLRHLMARVGTSATYGEATTDVLQGLAR